MGKSRTSNVYHKGLVLQTSARPPSSQPHHMGLSDENRTRVYGATVHCSTTELHRQLGWVGRDLNPRAMLMYTQHVSTVPLDHLPILVGGDGFAPPVFHYM